MRLTWRDAAATLVVAVAMRLYWAFSSTGHGAPDRGRRGLGVHGAVAFVITVLVLITASSGLLAALVGLLVLLWLATTVHHALLPVDRGDRAADRQPPLERPARR